jgi:hypothetical protein
MKKLVCSSVPYSSIIADVLIRLFQDCLTSKTSLNADYHRDPPPPTLAMILHTLTSDLRHVAGVLTTTSQHSILVLGSSKPFILPRSALDRQFAKPHSTLSQSANREGWRWQEIPPFPTFLRSRDGDEVDASDDRGDGGLVTEGESQLNMGCPVQLGGEEKIVQQCHLCE